MTSIQVAVSGSVGKQVFPTTRKVQLCNLILSPSGANASVKVRDGNASGEVVFFGRAPSAQGTLGWDVDHNFTKGMHVLVLGTNAQAYLIFE